MKKEGKLFRDDKGYPRAEAKKPYQLVALFLESEIQSDTIYCKEVLQIIDKIKNHEIKYWEETGNANTLILNPEKAVINNEMTNQISEVALDDLQKAILDWISFLEQP